MTAAKKSAAGPADDTRPGADGRVDPAELELAGRLAERAREVCRRPRRAGCWDG